MNKKLGDAVWGMGEKDPWKADRKPTIVKKPGDAEWGTDCDSSELVSETNQVSKPVGGDAEWGVDLSVSDLRF